MWDSNKPVDSIDKPAGVNQTIWDIFVSGTGWHVQAFIISVYAFIGMVAVGEKSNGKNSSEGTTLH